MEFSGIEIILLIASSIILGATFLGAIFVVFYLKNKSTKRKKIKRKKMTEQLYEKIINERDDKLRQEIENALNQQISTQNTNSKSSYYKKNSKHKQRDNVLYEKCENFILQLTKTGSEFIGESEENIKYFLKELHIGNPDKLYSKSKNKFDYLSKKTLDFMSRNKTKIDKLQKIKDIWNSNN